MENPAEGIENDGRDQLASIHAAEENGRTKRNGIPQHFVTHQRLPIE